jgi:hypothetical protein
MYKFTKLAIELNEPEPDVAPTDSRNRPDQRLMEEGNWDEANRVKEELEDKQRLARRKREEEAEQAMRKGSLYSNFRDLRKLCPRVIFANSFNSVDPNY